VRVHVIRHVPFEGPGLIAEWARDRGHRLSESNAVAGQYPRFDEVDFVVVMGGPMAADDIDDSPWLLAEKRYLSRTIAQGRSVFGVCLGAQIVADVAGGRVRRNPEREIGWFPVVSTPAAADDPVFSAFPDGLVVGHWHGDTFDLPPGAEPMLGSEATPNQAFSLAAGRVVGVQFHLEWTEESLAELLHECDDELTVPGGYVSSAESMLAEAPSRIPACREALFAILDSMESLTKEP